MFRIPVTFAFDGLDTDLVIEYKGLTGCHPALDIEPEDCTNVS